MSSSGPPPAWNRKSGFGCHDSGPGLCSRVSAVSGAPIAPPSTRRRAVCRPAPRNVSGAVATRRPDAWAASSSWRPLSRSRANGFSVQTCLPAARTWSATSTCAFGIVRLTTISTASSASSCSTVPNAGMPYFFACSSARPRSRSATKRTSTSGNVVRLSRYCELMTPAPITPTPTVPVRSVTRGSPSRARRSWRQRRRTGLSVNRRVRPREALWGPPR